MVRSKQNTYLLFVTVLLYVSFGLLTSVIGVIIDKFQIEYHDYTVSVINTNHKEHENMTAKVRVFNYDMTEKWSKEEKFTIEEDRYKELFKLPEIKGLSPVYFVKLELKNEGGKLVSDNFYWFSSKKKVDLKDVNKIKKVHLQIDTKLVYEKAEAVMTVTLKNPSKQLSFFNRLMITKGLGGDEVLPTFWSDNFFSLLPGEEKTVTARFAIQDLDGKEPVFALDKDI